ncbi:MAG: PEGA domain-containing protein [Chitinivibrionia bacterium]|nr:PEGA domain-containing protein [Chitinivibrionia bacterium]
MRNKLYKVKYFGATVLYFFVICLFPVNSFGRPQDFVREYNYAASEHDSKVTARDKAVEQMRAILLREIGQVVISEQRMENASQGNSFIYDNYSEKITAVAASMVKMDILTENWTGTHYYIRARIVVDPSEVSRRANEVLLNQKEMKTLQNKNQEVLQQVERLNSQLSTLRTQMRNNEGFLFGEINKYKQKEAEYLSRIARLTEGVDKRDAEIENYKLEIALKNEAIEVLNTAVAELKIQLSTAAKQAVKKEDDGQYIRISTQPAGALVHADGKYLGKSPLSYDNPPRGPISIKVRLVGYEQHTWNVNYTGGKQVLTKTLVKSPL